MAMPLVRTGDPTSSRRDGRAGGDDWALTSSIPGEQGLDITLEDGDLDGVARGVSSEDSAARVEPPRALGKAQSPATAHPKLRQRDPSSRPRPGRYPRDRPAGTEVQIAMPPPRAKPPARPAQTGVDAYRTLVAGWLPRAPQGQHTAQQVAKNVGDQISDHRIIIAQHRNYDARPGVPRPRADRNGRP